MPFPPPGDLPDPGIEPRSLMSPAPAVGFFTTTATGKALLRGVQKLPRSHNKRHLVSFWTPSNIRGYGEV